MSDKIDSLIEEMLPKAKSLVLEDSNVIKIEQLLIETTGKHAMQYEKEELDQVSMHGTLLLRNVGNKMCPLLKREYPNKDFRVIERWGSSPYISISAS